MTIKPSVILLATLLLLAPVAVAELGIRALIASDRLTEAPTSNDITDVALANLERLGRPDVLIIGNSTTRNGFQPDVLEDLIQEATGEEVTVQGMAQGAMSAGSQRLLMQGLADRGLLPDTVIVGLSPGALSLDTQDGDWFIRSELGRAWGGCADVELSGMADCLLGQVSAVWRWRGRPDRIVESAVAGMPTTFDHQGRVLQENGWAEERPATARRLRRVVPETLERLSVHAELPPVGEQRFVDLVEELRSHGVHVVVATQPYAPPLQEALVERNPDWSEELSAAYARLEALTGLDIAEVEAFGAWWTPAAQHDLRHLSREGAGPFVEQLWAMPEFRDSLLEGLALVD